MSGSRNRILACLGLLIAGVALCATPASARATVSDIAEVTEGELAAGREGECSEIVSATILTRSHAEGSDLHEGAFAR